VSSAATGRRCRYAAARRACANAASGRPSAAVRRSATPETLPQVKYGKPLMRRPNEDQRSTPDDLRGRFARCRPGSARASDR
jgi:hypothetical protein